MPDAYSYALGRQCANAGEEAAVLNALRKVDVSTHIASEFIAGRSARD